MADNQNKSIFQKIQEASHSVVDGYLESLKKSNPAVANQNYGAKAALPMRKAWDQDMERIAGEYGYLNKLTLLTDQHKLLMYLKDPIISSIIQKRTTQACSFAIPQKDKFSPGFMWEKRYPNKEGADEEQDLKEKELLTNFILNTGIKDDERTEAEEDMSFENWMRVSVKDTLIYDTLATEVVPDNTGLVHHWLPTSGATIRLAAPNLEEKMINDDIFVNIDPRRPLDEDTLKNGKYKYCQIVNGRIRKAFTKDELIVEFRNPVNDFFTNGYPISELDLLLNVVSAHLNADNYNRSIFTHGLTSSGIINLKGDVDDDQLKAMRRSWYAQGVGVDSMLKTPIVNTPEGIEFIKLDNSHKDLEYSNYIQYLIKLMCAIYQISPEEIGFTTGGKDEGGGNSQNYSNVERKIVMSQDAGLRPLLRFFENFINDKIMPKFSKTLNEKWVFKFVGLSLEDRNQELARNEKEIKTWKTVNEVRKEQGFPPIPGADSLILDSVYFQWWQLSEEGLKAQQKQNDMMAAAGGDGGGEEGAESDEDAVQYVDESGNPVNPEDIDPDSMEFTDAEGNPVDAQGNPKTVGNEAEEDSDEEDSAEKLPFEDDSSDDEEEKSPEDDKKLPFE